MLTWMLACSLNFGESPPLAPPDPQPAAEPAAQPLPRVIALITVDTWRADHFNPDHSPSLWTLAKDGERYTEAWSPIGLTTPAHVTMMTGLAPWEHGVEGNNHHGYTLAKDIPVVPERYPDWAKGAFVSAYPAGPAGGLARGWDVFDGPKSGERPGSDTVARALAWLPTDKPALMWVHVYEPHGPYVGVGRTERERYAEEVARADEALAPLIVALRERDALIVLTADHGEVLDEDRCSYQHERSISPHVLRVPLVRTGPGIAPAVIGRTVGLSDIPTLLAGEPVPGRPIWVAESGMCEEDCAPGCAPTGLLGRDRLVIDDFGQWVDRPGRGRFSIGDPRPETAATLDGIPPVRPPDGPRTDGARTLGYVE